MRAWWLVLLGALLVLHLFAPWTAALSSWAMRHFHDIGGLAIARPTLERETFFRVYLAEVVVSYVVLLLIVYSLRWWITAFKRWRVLSRGAREVSL